MLRQNRKIMDEGFAGVFVIVIDLDMAETGIADSGHMRTKSYSLRTSKNFTYFKALIVLMAKRRAISLLLSSHADIPLPKRTFTLTAAEPSLAV